MAMIPFTYRELRKAWRDNLAAAKSNGPSTNPHRLLLFYAVECGLKAAILKRLAKDHTDGCTEITDCKHDINKLLDRLSAGSKLKIDPLHIEMQKLRIDGNEVFRKCHHSEINQLWRYGGVAVSPSDNNIAKKLCEIATWIDGELR